MILNVRQHGKFKRDSKRLRKSGVDFSKLEHIIRHLAQRQILDARHHDRPLTGNWKGYRECHITPDWLLIYRIENNELQLARTGSHSELF